MSLVRKIRSTLLPTVHLTVTKENLGTKGDLVTAGRMEMLQFIVKNELKIPVRPILEIQKIPKVLLETVPARKQQTIVSRPISRPSSEGGESEYIRAGFFVPEGWSRAKVTISYEAVGANSNPRKGAGPIAYVLWLLGLRDPMPKPRTFTVRITN